MNQLVFEGGMYSLWDRKMAVALEQSVYDTLPPLDEVSEAAAGITWLVYDLAPTDTGIALEKRKVVYTKYPESWAKRMRQWTKTEKHFAKAVKEKYWETIIRCDKNGNIIDKP